jgi:putative hydrolase of the HAD superfamily
MAIPPDNLKALIFDLDDTLVVEEASAEAALLQTCELARSRHGIEPQDLHATLRQTCRRIWHQAPVRAYCIDIGVSSWEALWARFEGDNENLRILRDWAPSYRRNSWLEALAIHGIRDDELAHEMAETFPIHRRKLHIVYDDVRPTLDCFRARFRLGLLTNGAPDLQREKIAGAGIGGYFDEILVSGDLGFGKPDPRVFREILFRLGVTADKAIMIGNSLHSDIRGAQGIGMRAVWINRTDAPREDGVVPDWEISGLAELTRLLG